MARVLDELHGIAVLFGQKWPNLSTFIWFKLLVRGSHARQSELRLCGHGSLLDRLGQV